MDSSIPSIFYDVDPFSCPECKELGYCVKAAEKFERSKAVNAKKAEAVSISSNDSIEGKPSHLEEVYIESYDSNEIALPEAEMSF